MHVSSTQSIPATKATPQHLAIIMDGNGRWATQRRFPRTAGHIKGVGSVRRTVRICGEQNIPYLTLFSFSSENWRRPAEEVNLLMKLFKRALKKELPKLHSYGVRLRVVGNLNEFDPELQTKIKEAEDLTKNNNKLNLTIAANYGGRWDVLEATRALMQTKDPASLAKLPHDELEKLFSDNLCMPWAPEPDLFIRTGGEQRISNFLIWQLAYTELYFTDVYWPDFKDKHIHDALNWYANRERRFGRTSDQIQQPPT